VGQAGTSSEGFLNFDFGLESKVRMGVALIVRIGSIWFDLPRIGSEVMGKMISLPIGPELQRRD
jgi:hypothetical protein